MKKSSQISKKGSSGVASSSAADSEPYTYDQTHVKIVANENEAEKEAQLSVANGWGQKPFDADITANKNKAGERTQHQVANAEVVQMDDRSR